MRPFLISLAALLVSVPAYAGKSCDTVKSQIEAKVKEHKVASYTLEVVDKGKGGDAKVVGSCDQGAKEIVYKKK